MAIGTVYAIAVSCQFHDWLYRSKSSSVVGLGVFILIEGTIATRDLMLTYFNIERYFAVCRPILYQRLDWMKRGWIVAAVLWICGILAILPKALVLHPYLCLDNTRAVFYTTSPSLVYFSALAVVFPVVLFITIATLIILIQKKLRGLSRRRGSAIGEEMKRSSKYIACTSLLFYVTFTPGLIFLGVSSLEFPILYKYIMVFVAALCESSYGILNVFLYVYQHPAYLQQVKSLLCNETLLPPRNSSSTNKTSGISSNPCSSTATSKETVFDNLSINLSAAEK
ncbi:apelin receptor-like [Watersipora subatra]|uniref:apelin receptor-like n=1 Tax=Watersipora subatra TaxID=2589382 RepID=UPI00355B6973